MQKVYDFAPYAEDGVKADEPSNPFRFPIISNPYPRWYYITAVVVGGELWGGIRPTGEELAMVASWHEEYCSHWYGPPHTGYRGRVLDGRPFDIDGGAVGRYLIKRADGDWAYRISTWQYGPIFQPSRDARPLPLVDVLDRQSGHGDGPSKRWQAWKAEHPEIFSAVPSPVTEEPHA